jgi:solute carrier family 8 (sodium/calcium exchanger)
VNKRGLIVEGEAAEMGNTESGLKVFDEEQVSEEVREFEQSRRDYIQLLRDLRKKHPNAETEQLETLAREEILNKGPKSRAFYRMQATRKLMGGQNLMKKIHEKAASETSVDALGTVEVTEEKPKETHITTVYFDPAHYTVMESVGHFDVIVTRRGGDMTLSVLVDYKTEDGTATASTDYIPLNGTLTFGSGEKHKTITLEVIDDDVFEEDEHFYIRLSNVRFAHAVGGNTVNGAAGQLQKIPEVQLISPFLATVMILDDDHCGVFNILDKDVETVESVGTFGIRVSRWSGARGRVVVPYITVEGTAKPGKDYEHTEGELVFENNETE